MADAVTAKNDGAKFTPHPEGQYVARCVDVINLGERVEQYQQNPEKIVPKCALLFMTGEMNPDTQEPYVISQDFTVSMGERANLRKFLEDWRGKSYTDEQVDQGVPLDKLEGNPAFIMVEHKKSGAGRIYARIRTITPVPRGLEVPPLADYKRAPYWADRKKEYAEGVAKWKAKHMPSPSGHEEGFEDFPGPEDHTDDFLPF